jgi:hypothetical protein
MTLYNNCTNTFNEVLMCFNQNHFYHFDLIPFCMWMNDDGVVGVYSITLLLNGFIPVQRNRAIQLNGSPGCNKPISQTWFACFKFNSLTFVKFSSPTPFSI